MKNLIIFLAGLLTGIAGVFFYQVFGKPALPKPDLSPYEKRWGYGSAYNPTPATGVEHTMLQFKKDGECGEPWGNPTPLTTAEGRRIFSIGNLVKTIENKEERSWDYDLEPGEMIF